MTRVLLVACVLAAAPASAEPMGPCEGGVCDIDHGERPWVLTDDCHEDHAVVGYEHCGRYGDWSKTARDPDIAVEVGVGWRHVLAPPAVVRTIARGGREPRLADLGTGELRLAVGRRGIYGGLELSVGDLTRETYPLGAFVQGGAILGARLPLGPFAFGVELFGGGRSIRLTDNINNNRAPADRSAVVEARVRAGLWVTPWLIVDASAGTGLLDRREWLATLAVGFHSRAFAGER